MSEEPSKPAAETASDSSEPPPFQPPFKESKLSRFSDFLFGPPRDIKDPHVYHRISLIAFLAWIGLGADGLSSSAYGPDEAFRALGSHTHMAVWLALMTTVTIVVISIAYSNLIEHFPGGGGGYLVASKLLGPRSGVVSGCALLVDYVLTISVSIASGCDALWSFLPPNWAHYKLTVELGALIFLVLLNLRGVKESVQFVAPIFMVFVATHLFTILYVLGSHLAGLPAVFSSASVDFHGAVSAIGFWPVIFILLHAYSMGGGTYTGIEAVSNGLTMLREPRVQTGKRTMLLMAGSLAFTASGIILGYLLVNARPTEGMTMNAVLFQGVFGTWTWGGFAVGKVLVIVTLVSEACLLFVAAQTGFLDGPRILANMAVDSWMPHRFAQLSSRLVTQNGIYLMAGAAVAALLYTKGDVTTLVVMYSINVFLTFSLTELGMARHWIVDRDKQPRWKSQLAIHGTGLVMCLCILSVTLFEKFAQGGWITAAVTSALIGLCFWIRARYREVSVSLNRLDELLTNLPMPEGKPAPAAVTDKRVPTAVVMVNGFSGFGMHQLLSIQKLFPYYFKNFVFISVALVDSGNFKGAEAIGALETKTREGLERYVEWCRRHGFNADYRMATDTEVVEPVVRLCEALAREYPRAIFFSGKLIFKEERFYHILFHNETAYAVQNRLQFDGLQSVVWPIRVL